MSGLDVDELSGRLGILIETMDPRYFDDTVCRTTILDHFHVSTLEGLGIADFSCGICAAGALLSYLFETQKTDLSHITEIRPYHSGEFMVLDGSTMRNLELTETLREKEKRGSLFWILDRTRTAMGGRLLRSWIEQPLLSKEAIDERLCAVEALNENEITCAEIREYLGPVYDLERLAAKISIKSANPRDLVALKSSMEMLPHIKQLLAELPADRFRSFYENFDTLEDLCDLIGSAIIDDPPLAMKEGGIIRDHYNEEVDAYRSARTEGKTWLMDLEAEEKAKTGISTLKVKYNRVFGYVIEVSNSFKDKVPDTYTSAVRDKIGENIPRIQNAAKIVAEIDVYASFSEVARKNRYVRPVIATDGVIDIRQGRHPVVEKMIKSEAFVPNDTVLDNKKKRISIITGPNMAGKSTYMRQTALIVLMAQIGSFVPAKSAKIGIVDRIFTRVGASDDLASGQSTFMVEMTEVANILKSATSRSLLILDEIGRGTSTFDGLSIAWAVVEYIADRKIIGAKTLFATHYHELTELEGKIDGVNNFCIAVREKGDTIVFLRKIVKGGADKSYGVQVARLAGVPEAVLTRAQQLVGELSKADITSAIETISAHTAKKHKPVHYDEVDLTQMTLFDTVKDEDVLKELSEIDVSTLTPIETDGEINESDTCSGSEHDR